MRVRTSRYGALTEGTGSNWTTENTSDVISLKTVFTQYGSCPLVVAVTVRI
jgi:hypothetical protein